MNDGGKFKITQAVIKGCNITVAEGSYLARAAAIPFGLSLVTGFYIELVHADAGLIERFLWDLPAAAAFAWFLFVQTRLIFMGERIDRLTKAELLAFPRRRAMQVAVMIALLFNMGMTAIAAFLIWAAQENSEVKTTGLSVATMFCIGACFWALRLGFTPILAAIDAPIRKFLYLVNGMSFSMRIIGMMLLCFLPVSFVGHAIASMVVKDFPFIKDPTPQEIYSLIAIESIISMIAFTLLNAAACYAIREVLEREGRNKKL